MHHNAKDIISKTIIKRLIENIAKYIFDLDIQSMEILETQLQRVEERRADIVVKVSEKNRVYLLHIEIQNNNEHKMPYRMLRYFTDISSQYPGFEIEQYLIYIGKSRLNMPDGLKKEGLDYRYHLIDMHSIDCEYFLHAENPDALILAILCDFKGRDEKEVIQYIIQSLKRYHHDNEKAFRDAMSKLEVLSINRELTATVREEEQMLSVRWNELPSYDLGKEEGIKEGIKEGIEKGKNEGLKKGKTEMILNAHKEGLDIQVISRISGLSVDEIKKIIG